MKKLLTVILLVPGCIAFSQDFDVARPTGSSANGINIANFYNTNIQLTAHTHSASHGILFNSYKPITTVSGSLGALGNTKHSQGAGAYGGGAGALMFYGNGGTMEFLISETSPGADVDVVWGSPKMTINKSGFVGIGISSPSKKLDVNGDARIGNLTSRQYLKISSSQYPEIRFETPSSNEQMRVGVSHADHSGYGLEAGDFYIYSATVAKMPFIVRKGGNIALNYKGGNVGIGTTTPDEKLTVKGKIHTEEVRVDLSVPGPDYVFESDYNLRTLAETEQYIQANKHLPEIPSAKEMEANGVELGVMNMLLLKKIEELTLYVLELKKENEDQQEEINSIKSNKKK